MLIIAAVLLVFIGFVHSILGERYILVRLFKRDNLPKLYGGDWFTKQVLRFAWHLTTLAWWGFAAILYVVSTQPKGSDSAILNIIASVFLVSGICSAYFSKGKHLSWIVFLSVAGFSYYASTSS